MYKVKSLCKLWRPQIVVLYAGGIGDMYSYSGFAIKLLFDFCPGHLASVGIGFFICEIKRDLAALTIPHPLQNTPPMYEIWAVTGKAAQDKGQSWIVQLSGVFLLASKLDLGCKQATTSSKVTSSWGGNVDRRQYSISLYPNLHSLALDAAQHYEENQLA